MVAQKIHVMFGGSAAYSLRAALAKAQRDEQVVHQNDDFSFGPIDLVNPQARAQWVADKLGIDGWEEVSIGFDPIVAISLAPDILPIAWFSKRDACSFTGFLEWLWRLGEAPCEVVDVSELKILPLKGRSRLVVSPSSITPVEFVENGLLDGAVPLTAESRTQFHRLWGKLKSENAHFAP